MNIKEIKKEFFEDFYRNEIRKIAKYEIDLYLLKDKEKTLNLKDFNNDIVEYTKTKDEVKEGIKKSKEAIKQLNKFSEKIKEYAKL